MLGFHCSRTSDCDSHLIKQLWILSGQVGETSTVIARLNVDGIAMGAAQFDVFISYRRKDNSELAQLVRGALTNLGLSVFLDVTGLGSGHFDTALLRVIEATPDFVLILSAHSLDGSLDSDDWLGREIAHAIRTRRNIVPLVPRDFAFPPPDRLPEALRDLARYQCAIYDHSFSDESIGRLHGMLKSARRGSRWRSTKAAVAVLVLALIGLGTWISCPRHAVSVDNTVRSSAWEIFRANRPAGATASETNASYRPVTPPLPTASDTGMADAIIGITVLRLRPAAAADDGEVRLLVHDETTANSVEWTPVRAGLDNPLTDGDRIRLSIETSGTGYLYVVDREQYANGRASDPVLIFPTLRIHFGDNAVAAGRVIEIPAWDDSPPFFHLRRSRPDQLGEILTLLVTKQPLPGLTIGRQPLRLSSEQVQAWETKWGSAAERLELVGGEGKPYSKTERAAGANGSRLLTQSDPLPQSIMRVSSQVGDPFLVQVPLKIK